MAKYKKNEIELSEHLLHKLFEFVKTPTIEISDFTWIISNIVELSKCDEMLTLDEFDKITRKPISI